MEFVSNNLRKITRWAIALGLAVNTYSISYANYFENSQYEALGQNKPAIILDIGQDSHKQTLEYGQHAEYNPKPNPKDLPMHYFDGFVGFFNPETKEIGVVPDGHAPAENGNYSKDHIKLHEGLHWYADRDNRDHDEAWFNRLAANRLAGKTGIDRFPFQSYLDYSMF